MTPLPQLMHVPPYFGLSVRLSSWAQGPSGKLSTVRLAATGGALKGQVPANEALEATMDCSAATHSCRPRFGMVKQQQRWPARFR